MTTHADGHVQTRDERYNDALQVAATLAGLSSDDAAAEAYDHISHGCPLDGLRGGSNEGDDEFNIACPICDTPEMIALQARAFFGSDDATGVR